MADGVYERRGPREAELKRFNRLLASLRRATRAADDGQVPPAPPGDGPAPREG
jgi:hypothetical protein